MLKPYCISDLMYHIHFCWILFSSPPPCLAMSTWAAVLNCLTASTGCYLTLLLNSSVTFWGFTSLLKAGWAPSLGFRSSPQVTCSPEPLAHLTRQSWLPTLDRELFTSMWLPSQQRRQVFTVAALIQAPQECVLLIFLFQTGTANSCHRPTP